MGCFCSPDIETKSCILKLLNHFIRVPVSKLSVEATNISFSNTYFLYGLQAAMNLRSSETGLPYIRRSQIISLIKPMASVVFASSKNATVSSLFCLFLMASHSAIAMNLIISSSLVPPCTYSIIVYMNSNIHPTIY